ncbi:hypothetical protein BBD42_21015 [Paenibacillus sp. BIHB 4019]|uniref:Stc1 domain-containing protein n=1 Tax=Paenibacillus sp. BIHB 4019 TaxID=1870819 RepID=A0A1B2DLS1_9BACL|nr:hypothetical protein [Paenibacillus sp. BIHB 4019]ANY68670.1 hypothetical protein BBD42_21015 [Paenibacillus sp. BIHB 4019]
MIGDKQCKTCKEVKPSTEFYSQDNICKQCVRLKSKENLLKRALEPKEFVVEKQCARCKRIKPRFEFLIDKYTKDGLRNSCHDCEKLLQLEYDLAVKARREANPDFYQVAEKKCSHCKEVKQRSEFSKHSYSLDGLQTYCKACRGVLEKKRREKLKEQVLESVIIEKRCKNCRETKQAMEFTKSFSSKDGFSNTCRTCMSIQYRNRKREKQIKERIEAIGYVEIEKVIPKDIDLNQIKNCTKCNMEKTLREFNYSYTVKKFRPECKQCGKETRRNYAVNNEIERLQRLKQRRDSE